jgi:hypothetical protein
MTSSPNRGDGLYALNAVCPYFTMFPLEFPISVLRELDVTRKRQGIVVDPFCGRGTTNLAALIFGKDTVGVDCAPVAVAATAGKLRAAEVSVEGVVAEAKMFLDASNGCDVPDGEFWSLAFERSVLRGICALREGLKSQPSTPTRDLLRAIMLGALHGPRRVDGSSSYLSNQMPRTYAPKPSYSVRYWQTHGMTPAKTNVLSVVEMRAKRILRFRALRGSGSAYQADSRTFDWHAVISELGPARWIVTSPPYYGLRTYRPDQWIREWFLGGPSHVVYVSKEQLRHSSPEDFMEDLFLVWNALQDVANPDAKLIFRFGAINDRPISVRKMARASLRDTRWRIDEIRSAGVASHGHRQARSFNRSSKPALTEIDIWCSLR